MSNKSCAWMFTWLLFLALTPEITAQKKKPFFEIRSVDTWEVTKVKRGDFLHCIYKDPLGQELFAFGAVATIRQDGVVLRKNRFMKGRGEFIYFSDITNIEKVRLVKRSIPLLCMAGFILGEMMIIDGIPDAVIHPLTGIAAVVVLTHVMKHKRKSLYRNRIPDAVIVVPPASGNQEVHGTEPSSSLNQPE
ncbi:hypothetical protein [Dyadobacter sandarakinus]|uniref:Uncharacterized protein n=1 Tax=Dyadobacter sandarakinus TaxID=2747268 RepID=A0ABX7I9V1_9BACT|nr:hypothetical protein [Dyadobacter sandarakinus]QRR02588.1 hypothetical protein HWI92_17565 [Dyadobacter sandarakinus]